MPKETVSTSGAPAPAGFYSQAVLAAGMLFSAGFGPQDPDSGKVADTVAEQTAQVLTNLRAVLEAAGGSLDDVVKVTAYLANLDRDFAAYNKVYGQFFAEPWPARTTVGAQLPGILVEIDVVASVPRSGRGGV